MARHIPKDIRYGEDDEWKAVIAIQDEAGKAMSNMENHLLRAG